MIILSCRIYCSNFLVHRYDETSNYYYRVKFMNSCTCIGNRTTLSNTAQKRRHLLASFPRCPELRIEMKPLKSALEYLDNYVRRAHETHLRIKHIFQLIR